MMNGCVMMIGEYLNMTDLDLIMSKRDLEINKAIATGVGG
jgi:hypothetical protein